MLTMVGAVILWADPLVVVLEAAYLYQEVIEHD
jgi:hypothetical protein